jgi:hypothetical protein
MGFDSALMTMMEFVCGTTGGWRKMVCVSGAGLTNFCVMGKQRAFLYDVKDCTDLQKNAEGIADLLEDMAVGIMGEGDAQKFAGWVMDSTCDSVADMSILEERRPEWVSVGCTGHCAALSMKDFCSYNKTIVSACGTFELMRQNARILSSESYAAQMRPLAKWPHSQTLLWLCCKMPACVCRIRTL